MCPGWQPVGDAPRVRLSRPSPMMLAVAGAPHQEHHHEGQKHRPDEPVELPQTDQGKDGVGGADQDGGG